MAAYDGDGNRVYQLSYNPEKDEDFSAYYRSHKNADYDGTGIQLKAWGEVSATEEELMGLMGASGAVLTSRYELIEYVNDVNREHAEVLVEQNLNGRAGPVLLRDHGQLPDGGRIPWEHPGAPDAE